MTRRFRIAVVVVVATVTGLLSGCSGTSGSGEPGQADSLAAPATDIYLAPLQTDGGLAVGEPAPLVDRPGYDNQPAFSATGTSLLFVSRRDGQADLHRITLGTFDVTRITGTPESEYSPTPRPDERISVVRVEEDGRQRLWQYSAFGRPIAPMLPEADSIGYHAWIDRTRVALYRVGDPAQLVVADVTTDVDTVVADSIGRSLQPIPGRAAVSFVRVAADASTSVHLVARSDSLTTRPLVDAPAGTRAVDHAWTPDGTLLLAGGQTLYAWRPGRAGWRQLRDLAPLEVTRLAVSPDGTQLALVVRERGAGGRS